MEKTTIKLLKNKNNDSFFGVSWKLLTYSVGI